MNLSIIIVTHNSNKYIDGAINSIYVQRYKKYKIFIIDNNSLDKKYLQKYNINTAGRFGDWEYINSDKCIRKGMQLAKKINDKTVI